MIVNSTNKSKMRSKAGKLMKIVLATFRVVGKANALYMKSMEKASSGGLLPCPSPQHQPVKLQNFSRSRSVVAGCSKPCEADHTGGIMRVRRNYSVGVGKIGRIDEDRTCSFRVLDANDLLFYPTSRSCAVQKTSITQH